MPTKSDLLERSRFELLDLSTRNRLLSIPVSYKSARIIEVHDEVSEEVYRLLVTEKKSLSFLPGRRSKVVAGGAHPTVGTHDEEEIGLPQPEEEEPDSATGIAKRHSDSRLQTTLSPFHLTLFGYE